MTDKSRGSGAVNVAKSRLELAINHSKNGQVIIDKRLASSLKEICERAACIEESRASC